MNLTILPTGRVLAREPAPAGDAASGPGGATLPHGWLGGGSVITKANGAILEANDSFLAWCGLTTETPQGKLLPDLLASRFAEWREPVRALLGQTAPFGNIDLSGGGPDGRQWYCLEVARHGEVIFCRLNSVLPPLSELEESAWDAHLDDEAARRQMFLRMVRAESQLQCLMQRWPGVVFNQRADFSFHFISPRIEELTGIPADQWRTQPQMFWKVVHEADVEELQQHLKRVARADHGVTRTYRVRHVKTGRVAYILEHRKTLWSAAGLVLGFEGVWLDVTRQTVAEKRLSSAAWKETLALLTIGLAHDFSNIMAGILSLSEAFQAQVDKDHPFHEGLALIKQNSKQASQLVHRILNLHRGKVGERNYYNLNELITDTVELVRKVVPRRIVIKTELASEQLPLYLDAVEFRQVFINLTLNAMDAMPQGGHLTFRTTLHKTQPLMPGCQGTLPRLPSVCLSVEDDGHGIPARHLASIFDPFFTTKALNKGSGLGLYNARLFVDKHEGAISVESEEKVKTVFNLCLPLADFTEAEKQLAGQPLRRHTLLLLGPAGTTLDNTAEFLRQHGFYVVVATGTDNAHELLRSPDYQFSGAMLLLTANDLSQAAVFDTIREQSLPVKTVLQIVNRNQDEVETQFLRAADLIITPDMPATDLTARLQSLLDGNVLPTL